jgi:hypothetical protein
VLGAALMVELCCFAVVHPHAAQLAPVHRVGLPSLQGKKHSWWAWACLQGRHQQVYVQKAAVQRSGCLRMGIRCTAVLMAAVSPAATYEVGLTSVIVPPLCL